MPPNQNAGETTMQILKNEDWFHEDGFPIAVERRDPQEAFGIHTHEFSEIVVVTGGEGLHVTGEDSWPLTTGDVFVIGGSRPHDYLNTNRYFVSTGSTDAAIARSSLVTGIPRVVSSRTRVAPTASIQKSVEGDEYGTCHRRGFDPPTRQRTA